MSVWIWNHVSNKSGYGENSAFMFSLKPSRKIWKPPTTLALSWYHGKYLKVDRLKFTLSFSLSLYPQGFSHIQADYQNSVGGSQSPGAPNPVHGQNPDWDGEYCNRDCGPNHCGWAYLKSLHICVIEAVNVVWRTPKKSHRVSITKTDQNKNVSASVNPIGDVWLFGIVSSCLTVTHFPNELLWTTSLSHSKTPTVLIINCDFPTKAEHLLEIEMSNAAVEQCY